MPQLFHTNIADLPASTEGRRRVQGYHLDDGFYLSDALALNIVQGLFAVGGITRVGSIDVSDDTVVTLTEFAGLTLEGRIPVWTASVSGGNVNTSTLVDFGSSSIVTDLGTPLNDLPTGTKCLLVLAPEPVTLLRTYEDPSTGETVINEMTVAYGRLRVIEGDTTDYPSPPPASLPLAYVTTGIPVVVDEAFMQPAALKARHTLRFVTAHYELDPIEDEGRYVIVTATADITIPPDLPEGWRCKLRHAAGAVAVGLVAGSGVTLELPGGHDKIAEDGRVELIADGDDNVYVDGDTTS